MAAATISEPVKGCTRCGGTFPASSEYFGPHPLGRFGLYPQCRPCKKLVDAERRARPDQKVRQQEWRNANKAKVRETNRAYRAAGYKSTEHVAQWRAANIDRARRQEARRMRERRAKDPTFRLLCRLRARLGAMVSKGGRRTDRVLGYTADELRAHLERQFVKGMGWHNADQWHVDHIIPVKAFSITSVDDPDFAACWALSNLRPIWADENRRKGARRVNLL
jgi:hypothetical protein